MIGKSDITDALVSVLASNWRQRVRRIGWEEPLHISQYSSWPSYFPANKNLPTLYCRRVFIGGRMIGQPL